MSLPLLQEKSRPGWVVPAALAALLALYFCTRLYHLLVFPVFTDEAGHMQVAYRIAHGAKKWRLMSDGRVLCAWFPSMVITWASDPLWASRFMSVLAGAVTLSASFATARLLFGFPSAVFTALWCIVCPYLLMYDRMVEPEPYLCAALSLTLWASVRLIKETTTRNAILLGVAMGLVPLGKIPGLMFLFMPFMLALCVERPTPFPWKTWGIAYGLGGLLIAYPLFYFLKNTEQLKLKAVAAGGPAFHEKFLNNLERANEWLWLYWSPGLTIFACLGLLYLMILRRGWALTLAAGMLVPVFIFCALAKFWVPRYLIFTSLPMVLLAGYGAAQWLENMRGRLRLHSLVGGLGLGAFVFVIGAYSAWPLNSAWVTSPENAPIAKADRTEYIENWSSGYTLEDTIQILQENRAAQPEGYNLVFHSGLTNTLRHLLLIYFEKDPKIKLVELDLDTPEALQQIDGFRAERTTWVFIYDMNTATEEDPDPRWHVLDASQEKLAERGLKVYAGRKPGGQPGAILYRLEPPSKTPPPLKEVTP